MQFGRVTAQELNSMQLGLPDDHPATERVLKAGGFNGKTEIRVGCTGWGLPDWVGKIYPRGTKPNRYLNEYARQFSCIEFNATYYKLPSLEQVKAWCAKTTDGFKFCPKFTSVITHEKQLKHTERELEAFMDVCRAFGEKLGPLFLMPHPQMGPAQAQQVLDFIGMLPQEPEVFTEFRHVQWFSGTAGNKLFDAMEKNGYGTVITDAAGRRDCVHMRLTCNAAFIRFVGNSLHPTDYTRINDWVDRLGTWMEKGLRSCWFFIHQHEEVFTPELCLYFIEKMNERYGLNIQAPRFMDEQEWTLF